MLQNKTRKYADALLQALEKESDEKKVIEIVSRLKKILRKHGQTRRTNEILKIFSKMWKERNGKIATIFSSESLIPSVENKMKKQLLEKKYSVEERVDPDLIGGLALYLGNDYLIDATIKGKLRKIRKSINEQIAYM